jgi:hypothetical protein
MFEADLTLGYTATCFLTFAGAVGGLVVGYCLGYQQSERQQLQALERQRYMLSHDELARLAGMAAEVAATLDRVAIAKTDVARAGLPGEPDRAENLQRETGLAHP